MNSDPDDARRNLSPVPTHIPQEGGLKKKKKKQKKFAYLTSSHGTGAQLLLDSQEAAPNHMGLHDIKIAV